MIWIGIAVLLVTAFLFFQGKNPNQDIKTVLKQEEEKETRGVFISYIEYMKYFEGKEKEEIKQEIDKMIEKVKEFQFNTIYLQVRPFSDSIYESKIYPFSHTISGEQGKEIGLDLLDYFLQKAHQENIKVHAWINPYRISNYTDTSFLSDKNPAKRWLNTNKVKIIEGKGIYYNPAEQEVIDLIMNGVEEIVENYEVDGILLDDYFYPDDTIDLENYQEVENTISIKDFRLSKVNELVSGIYQVIKKKNPDILFGISPDGNIENNYNTHYADVKTWLKEDGYIDYIMPQLYYGFFHGTKPYIETLNKWKEINVKGKNLLVALALYKAGEVDNYAKSGKNEWMENDDIIQKQILVSRNIPNYDGYALFRYDYLVKEDKNVNLQSEIKNYLDLFSKEKAY